MPIKIPDNLPAAGILEEEFVFVMYEGRAYRQDIRPLRILILNLMPNKIATETQLLRLLSNSPLQVEVDLIYTASYNPRNTSQDHLVKFYETFEDVIDRRYDGMIVTGAPVELMPFEEVAYWDELCRILDWSRDHVYSTLHICWGAQAGLYHHYGVPKYTLDSKMFGVFPHSMSYTRPVKLFRGFDDIFHVPHSRHTEIRREDILAVPGLRLLSESPMCGVYAVSDMTGRQIYLTGHSEYDPNTLKDEYERDMAKGLPIDIPYNYFAGDDPACPPNVTWRSSASLIFANWLNYYVYQMTPYNLENLAGVDASSARYSAE